MSLKTVELEAGEEFKLPPLDGRLLAPRVYTETFYDTARGRLDQAGFTLSRRLENGQGIWRLRVTCDGASTLELEALGGPAEPPDELRELITAASAGFTLAPAARVRTRSTNLRVKAGSRSLARIEVAWIAVLDGQRPARSFCQIELEPLSADRKEFARLEKALRKAGATPANGSSPLRWALEREEESEPPVTSPALEPLRAFFREQYARILAYDPGVRLGEDPEDVHQLRVAVRRLRSVLRTARPILDRAWVDDLRSELAWLAGELGPARDLDVLIPALWADAVTLERTEQQALTPLFGKFEEARAAAGEQALEALRSERYYALLASIEAAAAGSPSGGKGSLERAVRKEYQRLRRAMRDVDDDPTDDAIHRARIKGKRARYATELLEADLGKRGQKLIAAAKEFQDVAGGHHDTVVAEEQIRAQLRGLRSQATALAAGLLIGRQRERRRAAFEQLPKAWKRFDRAAKKVSA